MLWGAAGFRVAGQGELLRANSDVLLWYSCSYQAENRDGDIEASIYG